MECWPAEGLSLFQEVTSSSSQAAGIFLAKDMHPNDVSTARVVYCAYAGKQLDEAVKTFPQQMVFAVCLVSLLALIRT